VPLFVLYALIGLTLIDLFKARGWSLRTCELAFCVVFFNIYAIIWYWTSQLWLARKGEPSDGIAFRFSFRAMLIALVIWSMTLFLIVKLSQSLTSK
jgi:hypothetical protein